MFESTVSKKKAPFLFNFYQYSFQSTTLILPHQQFGPSIVKKPVVWACWYVNDCRLHTVVIMT